MALSSLDADLRIEEPAAGDHMMKDDLVILMTCIECVQEEEKESPWSVEQLLLEASSVGSDSHHGNPSPLVDRPSS